MPPKLGPVGAGRDSAIHGASTQPPSTREQARQALAAALTPTQAGAALDHTVADALLICLDGGRLDLNQMLPAWQDLVFQLSDAAWAALDACAAAGGAPGIAWIGLPPPDDDEELQAALARMNRLAHLRELLVRIPWPTHQSDETSITLQPLSGGPVKVVEIDFWHEGRVQVLAPDTLKVRARRSNPEYPTQKYAQTLSLTDAKGGRTVRGPVPDLGYFRKPTDFDGPNAAWNAFLSLNSRVRFDAKDGAAVALDRPTKDPSVIHCRHLSLAWIRARRAHLHDKDTQALSGASQARFSYRSFAQPADLARQVGPTAEADYLEIQRAQVPIVFTVPTFGQTLADQFRQMGHGQARHFFIITNNHALAVELQDKQRAVAGKPPTDRVILFYDPNLTATARRTVVSDLDRLATRSLAEWLRDADLRCYLGHEEPRTALMYRWEEPGSAEWDALQSSPGGIYGFDSGVTAGHALRYLRTTLEAGQARAVHATVEMLFKNEKLSDAQLRLMLSAAFPTEYADAPAESKGTAVPAGGPSPKPERSTLTYAMNWRKPAAVAAYLQGILFTPDARLAGHQRMGLTRDWPLFECTTVYARALLAAPAALVDPYNVRTRFWLIPTWASSPPKPTTPQYWYDIVHEVAVCPDGAKAFYARSTQSQRADPPKTTQVPNPCAAAAMLCAVFDARIDPSRRQSLLGWLEKDPTSVLQTLVSSSGPDELHWAARLLRALPPALTRRLDPSFETLIDSGVVPPSKATPAARLLAAPAVWMAGTGLPAQGYQAAGLRALHLDSNPTWMVCTADEPIPELVGLRLLPGTRLGRDMSFEDLRYLLPVSQLRTGSEKAEADHKGSSATTTTTTTTTSTSTSTNIVDA